MRSSGSAQAALDRGGPLKKYKTEATVRPTWKSKTMYWLIGNLFFVVSNLHRPSNCRLSISKTFAARIRTSDLIGQLAAAFDKKAMCKPDICTFGCLYGLRFRELEKSFFKRWSVLILKNRMNQTENRRPSSL